MEPPKPLLIKRKNKTITRDQKPRCTVEDSNSNVSRTHKFKQQKTGICTNIAKNPIKIQGKKQKQRQFKQRLVDLNRITRISKSKEKRLHLLFVWALAKAINGICCLWLHWFFRLLVLFTLFLILYIFTVFFKCIIILSLSLVVLLGFCGVTVDQCLFKFPHATFEYVD